MQIGVAAEAPTIRRILLAIALSPGATALLRAALRIARSFQAHLAVAHVDREIGAAGEAPPVGRRAHRASELRQLIDSVPEGEQVTEAILLTGTPADAVVRYAGEGLFDLVVVGGNERGPAERLLAGHTALTIVRRAHCPVLCVDTCRPLEARARSVVLAADLRPASAVTATLAAELAARLGAALTAVHVSGLLTGNPYGVSRVDALTRTAEIDSTLDELRRSLGADMKAHGGNARDAHARRVESTDVVQGVLRAAADARCDLLVCGACELLRHEHARLGSVCDGLLRRATFSVLVARTPAPE